MTKSILTFLLMVLCTSPVYSDDNFCRKCQVMRDYHEKNPSKYEYYDDYLKDVEENGEESVNPNFEDLPDDVKRIMDPEGKKTKKSR